MRQHWTLAAQPLVQARRTWRCPARIHRGGTAKQNDTGSDVSESVLPACRPPSHPFIECSHRFGRADGLPAVCESPTIASISRRRVHMRRSGQKNCVGRHHSSQLSSLRLGRPFFTCRDRTPVVSPIKRRAAQPRGNQLARQQWAGERRAMLAKQGASGNRLRERERLLRLLPGNRRGSTVPGSLASWLPATSRPIMLA